jgi:hypothetical protein
MVHSPQNATSASIEVHVLRSFPSTRIQKVNSNSATIRHFGLHRSTEGHFCPQEYRWSISQSTTERHFGFHRSTQDHFRPQEYRRSIHSPPQNVISASTEILRIISIHKNIQKVNSQSTTERHFGDHRNTEDHFRPQKYRKSIHSPPQNVISAFTEILRIISIHKNIQKFNSQSTTERHFTVHRNTENQEYGRSIRTPLQNVISASSEGVRMEPQEKKSH